MKHGPTARLVPTAKKISRTKKTILVGWKMNHLRRNSTTTCQAPYRQPCVRPCKPEEAWRLRCRQPICSSSRYKLAPQPWSACIEPRFALHLDMPNAASGALVASCSRDVFCFALLHIHVRIVDRLRTSTTCSISIQSPSLSISQTFTITSCMDLRAGWLRSCMRTRLFHFCSFIYYLVLFY